MKICIDINSTLKFSTGIGKFTIALVKALVSLSWFNEHKIVLCYRKRFFDFKKRCPNVKSDSIEYFNTYKRDLPKANIYLTSSYGFKFSSCGKNILIIHDLIPLVTPELSSIDAKNILLNSLPGLIKNVDRIICVSQNTRNDLVRFYPDVKDKTE
ncbi:MAG: hypothetical protein P9M06_00745, partial [Candidatus Saelkia tenebricola]|nr:hypothetical protein [Candidatus Saelkia tenebricola]